MYSIYIENNSLTLIVSTHNKRVSLLMRSHSPSSVEPNIVRFNYKVTYFDAISQSGLTTFLWLR